MWEDKVVVSQMTHKLSLYKEVYDFEKVKLGNMHHTVGLGIKPRRYGTFFYNNKSCVSVNTDHSS